MNLKEHAKIVVDGIQMLKDERDELLSKCNALKARNENQAAAIVDLQKQVNELKAALPATDSRSTRPVAIGIDNATQQVLYAGMVSLQHARKEYERQLALGKQLGIEEQKTKDIALLEEGKKLHNAQYELALMAGVERSAEDTYSTEGTRFGILKCIDALKLQKVG